MKKYSIIAILLFFCNFISAQTIWCKQLKLGCLTEEDKEKIFAKEFRLCKLRANNTYTQAINEGLGDEDVWKLQGFESVQEYANFREKFNMNLCMKNVKYP